MSGARYLAMPRVMFFSSRPLSDAPLSTPPCPASTQHLFIARCPCGALVESSPPSLSPVLAGTYQPPACRRTPAPSLPAGPHRTAAPTSARYGYWPPCPLWGGTRSSSREVPSHMEYGRLRVLFYPYLDQVRLGLKRAVEIQVPVYCGVLELAVRPIAYEVGRLDYHRLVGPLEHQLVGGECGYVTRVPVLVLHLVDDGKSHCALHRVSHKLSLLYHLQLS